MRTMELLAKKAGDAHGIDITAAVKESDPLPPSDLSELPEQSVKEWVSQLPTFYESIATELDTQGEKTTQTNKKLQGLLTVARKNLRRSKAQEEAAAALPSSSGVSSVSSVATAPTTQWGYSLLK